MRQRTIRINLLSVLLQIVCILFVHVPEPKKKSDFKSIVYGAICLCGLDFVLVWNIFVSRSHEICKL